MYSYSRFLSLICFLLSATACSHLNRPDTDDGSAIFNADSFKQHVSVLASDSFMGRKPFTAGETITINYLETQLKNMGLEPGNGSSYFQDVPMVNIMATAAPTMQVNSPKGNFTLKGFDEYAIWTDKVNEQINLDKTEVVFAGYGVVAPEYHWNDYAGLDVKGKVVMVMVNDPGFWVGDTTLFKGKEMTYYGRWTYKFEEAARQGAKACLIIHNTAAASYPFAVQQSGHNSSRLQLDNRGKEMKNCDVIGWIPEPTANKLFTAAGFDSTLLIKANKPGFKAVPLNISVTTSMTVKTTYSKSHNVIAKVTGSKHPDEVIIYTAHWDHFGIGRPDVKGDSIYNGAYDNASGTSGLLEMARAFKAIKPERTVVIMLVTSEEQGLLGSKYYAENPVYPVDKTVANINIDELNRFTKTKDMVIVGSGQSELEDYLKEELAKTGGYISSDPHPEAGYYYRSDHFNFAKAGIPALYINPGIDVVGKGKEYGKQLEDEYTKNNYHQPSDEYDPKTWTAEGAVNDMKILFRVGKRLAFSETWPKWKTGSEFKAIREGKNK